MNKEGHELLAELLLHIAELEDFLCKLREEARILENQVSLKKSSDT
jgi:uncharacterized small protein (DUF1192 family)